MLHCAQTLFVYIQNMSTAMSHRSTSPGWVRPWHEDPRVIATIGVMMLIIVSALVLTARASFGREWTEDIFEKKTTGGTPYVAIASRDADKAHSVIGSIRYYQTQKQDTFLDIARYYGLGYQDLLDANPSIDPWVPPPGQIIMLPTEFVLPDAEYTGVVVNIPEMRLFYFHKGGAGTLVTTYPVGLGRDEWRTPQGPFKVRGKTVNPTWVLPESIKKEHRADGRPAPDFIAGGDPDNPLGKYRLELTIHGYGIHGTNIPWGVGMQVSHGCVRLYPEDIERLFPMIPVGMTGQFVYQPVKVGARDGRIYIEMHRDIYNYLPAPYREARRLIEKNGWTKLVDMKAVEHAVTEQNGVPVDITLDTGSDDIQDETLPSMRTNGGRSGQNVGSLK
jgi:L,D-transpeptidase ErfK/SrfK